MQLNSRPEPYKVKTSGLGEELGLAAAVKNFYKSSLTDEPKGTVIIRGVERSVEPELVAMLRAILAAGICKFEERATACRKVFLSIAAYDTKSEVLNAIATDSDDAFVNEVYRAIKEVWA